MEPLITQTNNNNVAEVCQDKSGKKGEKASNMTDIYLKYFRLDWKILRDLKPDANTPLSDIAIQMQIYLNEQASNLSVTICRLQLSDPDSKLEACNYPFVVLRLMPLYNRLHIKQIDIVDAMENNPCVYEIFHSFMFPHVTAEILKTHFLDCSIWVVNCSATSTETTPVRVKKQVRIYGQPTIINVNTAKTDGGGTSKICRFWGISRIDFQGSNTMDNRRIWYDVWLPDLVSIYEFSQHSTK